MTPPTHRGPAVPVTGLHHVTAISGPAPRNVAFYRDVLGMRFIKRTVNFDDPGTHHLYYGDGVGSPGTAITFFPWAGVPPGRRGSGEVGATAYAVPRGSLPFWRRRLEGAGVTVAAIDDRFGSAGLAFADESGGALELLEAEGDGAATRVWTSNGVGAGEAIRGFHAPTLVVADAAPTRAVLTAVLGMREVARQGDRTRYAAGEGGAGFVVDLVERAALAPARQGAGSVHHLAFRVPDDAAQAAVRRTAMAAGQYVSEVRDRMYFRSIYFREPGGILFEVATDRPGFTVDEPEATLGTALKLPPHYEPLRAELERVLPDLG